MERAFTSSMEQISRPTPNVTISGRPISRSTTKWVEQSQSASNFARETSVPNTDRAIHKLRVDVVGGCVVIASLDVRSV